MRHTLFVETTIPSYYVSRPSQNVLQVARQELTREWWDERRHEFDLYTTQIVLDEAAGGETAKAAERLRLMAGIPLLTITEQVEALAGELVDREILPTFAGRDALHLAAAGVHGIEFLLTWNCKHIANPFLADRLESCFSAAGFDLPVLCTPEQFTPDVHDEP